MRRFLIAAMMIAAAVSSVNAQTASRSAANQSAELDENCRWKYTGPVGSWSDLGADAPRVLEERRRQQDACREALMLKQEQERAARETAADEPAPFVLRSVVTFSEPTMSCPNIDDAVAANGQSAEWLAAHNCKNLDPNLKEWVVVTAGSKRLLKNRRTVETWGCVVNKRRWDQLKEWADSHDPYHLGINFAPVQQQLGKECLHVVRKVQY
jgi:hypothetical protein